MPSLVGGRSISEGTHALTVESALVIWEYTITIADEVDIFWRKRMTPTSLLFVATRWIMVASALLQFAPVTEATSDFMLLPRMSDIDIFRSNCAALTWVLQVLFYAEYVVAACKKARFSAISLLCVINST